MDSMAYGSSPIPAGFAGFLSQNTDEPPGGGNITSQYRAGVQEQIKGIEDDRKKESEAPLPEPPKLDEAPKAENFHTDPMQTFGSPAMWLATFGSLMTRRPLTAALNSGAAVMNAVNQKDAAAYDKAFNEWKVNTENAWKLADWNQKHFDDIMERTKGDISARNAEISAWAAATQDPALEQALKTAQLENLHLDRQEKILKGKQATDEYNAFHGLVKEGTDAGKSLPQSYLDATSKMAAAEKPAAGDFKAQDEQQNLKNKATYVSEGVDKYKAANKNATPGELAAETERLSNEYKNLGTSKEVPAAVDLDKMPLDAVVPGTQMTARTVKEKGEQAIYDPSVLSRGGMPMADKQAVMNYQTKLMEQMGITPMDMIAIQSGLGASKTAVGAVTKQYSMVKSFEDNAEKNMKIVESLMDKGAGTEAGSVINRWLQAGKRATGDPDVIAFNTAMNEVKSEVAKITSGATGAAAATEGAIQRTNDALNEFDSPAAIHKTFDSVWRPSMKNRTDSLESIRDGLLKNISSGGKSPIGGDNVVHWNDLK